ncbi:MAG: hypothetical protein HZC51_07960 [Nitrospirae bacterium]|nr:hypothetical protein [Nitrospirota bacterium]
MTKRALVLGVAVMMLLSSAGMATAAEKSVGVYVKAISGMKADISQTADKARAALTGAGFTVLASYENGVPEGCKHRAMTVVFTKDDYAAALLKGGPDKGFALPLRLGLYEDEKGLNINIMNPVSIDRTMCPGGSMDPPADKVVKDVMAALKSVGPVAPEQAGQMREKCLITGMGGGEFAEKVEDVATSPKSLDDMAAAIKAGMSNPAGWHTVYTYKPSADVVIIGVTNKKIEGRAFGIAGDKRSNKVNPFPGVDHAAAFPIEVVLHKGKSGKNTAYILTEMWRMKLYFEDAGNWAYMKNMGMPGEIQDDIEKGVKAALK